MSRLQAAADDSNRAAADGEDPDAECVPANDGTSLLDAVREFNGRHQNYEIGQNQPPLTDDEVIASVRWTLQDAEGNKTRVGAR